MSTIKVDGGYIQATKVPGGRAQGWQTRVAGGTEYGSLDEILALAIVWDGATLFPEDVAGAITVERAREL